MSGQQAQRNTSTAYLALSKVLKYEYIYDISTSGTVLVGALQGMMSSVGVVLGIVAGAAPDRINLAVTGTLTVGVEVECAICTTLHPMLCLKVSLNRASITAVPTAHAWPMKSACIGKLYTYCKLPI